MAAWQKQTLGELCTILDSKRKPITKRDRDPGNVPYYGATGVLDYVAAHLFDEPLVLIGEDGAKWGAGEQSAFTISGPAWVNNHAHVLRPDRRKVRDQWLIYYLNHTDLSRFVTGLTVPKLNQEMLRSIPIPLPPLPEQQRIVAILDEAFEAIATAGASAEKNLINARNLYDQILLALFSEARPGWLSGRLGSVLEVVRNGVNCVQSKTDGDCRITRIETIASGEFDLHRTGRTQLNGREKERARLSQGDVLFSHINSAPHIGKSAILRQPVDLYHGINLLLLRPKRSITPALLHVLLQALHRSGYWRIVCKQSVNQASINQQDLAKAPICFPSLHSEQEKIVATAKEAQCSSRELVAVYTRKLALLAELKQSLLARAFSGELTASDALAA